MDYDGASTQQQRPDFQTNKKGSRASLSSIHASLNGELSGSVRHLSLQTDRNTALVLPESVYLPLLTSLVLQQSLVALLEKAVLLLVLVPLPQTLLAALFQNPSWFLPKTSKLSGI